MAAKKSAKPAKGVALPRTPPLLKLGDRVRILHFGGQTGRVVEYRGLLGPGGAPVYRIRYRRKPDPRYIELCQDQLELIPAKA